MTIACPSIEEAVVPPSSANSNSWTDSELAASNPVLINTASILDYTSPPVESRFNNCIDELLQNPICPITAVGNDQVWNITDIPNVPMVRICVKKPSMNGATANINNIPTNRTAAWTYVHDLLEDAADNNVGKIVFGANQRIELENPNAATGAQLSLKDFSDVDIDFNGSTLVFPIITAGIVIRNCQVMRLRNYIIECPYVTAVGATVLADPGSPTGYKFQVEAPFISLIEAEYGSSVPLRTAVLAEKVAGETTIKVVGTADTFMNRGTGTALNRWNYNIGGEINAITGFSHPSAPYAPGDLVIIQLQNNTAQTVVHKNDDCDVEDITHENAIIYNGGGQGWTNEVNRGLHLKNCTTDKHPTLPYSIIGCVSDTSHMNNNKGDIVVEDCDFNRCLDDFTTSKGNWWAIKSVNTATNKIVVDNVGTVLGVNSNEYNTNCWGDVGDKAVVMDRDTMVCEGTATITAISIPGNGKEHEITFSSIPSWMAVGKLIANPTRGSGRVLIQNNKFRYTRAQGAFIQSSYVKVADNEIQDTAGPGVEINFALQEWHESVMPGHILIARNGFSKCGVARTKEPYSIKINQFDGAGNKIDIIRNITLDANYFMPNNDFGSTDPRW